MPRSTLEWKGRTDDAMPPRSVFDRLWDKQGGRDAITGRPFDSKSRVIRDHIVPLADGGKNCESNLQLIDESTHAEKTAAEATVRGKVRRNHERHRGYVRQASKLRGAGFRKAPPQHTASTPRRKTIGAFEEPA